MGGISALLPVFNVTCTSTGGPATTVNWTRDGLKLVYIADGKYTFSQVLVNRETAEYTNTLTVTGRKPGNYQCIVSNTRGNATSKILTVNGK